VIRAVLPSRRLAAGLTLVLIATRVLVPASLGSAPPLGGWSSVLLAWVAMLFLGRLLADRTDNASALIAGAALLGASPLYDWLLSGSAMTAIASFCLATLLLVLSRRSDVLESTWGRVSLGVVTGVAVLVERQNAALLLLPAGALFLERKRGHARWWELLQLLTPFLVACSIPRSTAREPWTFASALNPWLWVEILFALRAGLVAALPLAWAALAGLGLMSGRAARTAGTLALTGVAFLLLLVGRDPAEPRNQIAGLLPLLAFAGVVLVQALVRVTSSRPWVPLLAVGGALTGWNFLLMEQYRLIQIPRDDTVSFARVAELAAGHVAQAVGNPLAWPANWAYAWRAGLPLTDFDRVVGSRAARDLRSGSVIFDIGDARTDQEFLGEGWSSPVACEGANCREIQERAVFWVARVRSGDLTVRVRAAGRATMTLVVNDVESAQWPLVEQLRDWEARVPAAQWRIPVTRIAVVIEPQAQARVDRIMLVRTQGARP
jgi:hypothetical protein